MPWLSFSLRVLAVDGKCLLVRQLLEHHHSKNRHIIRPRQGKICLRACAKCADSHRPAHAQSHSDLCSPLIHSIVSSDSGSGQRRPR